MSFLLDQIWKQKRSVSVSYMRDSTVFHVFTQKRHNCIFKSSDRLCIQVLKVSFQTIIVLVPHKCEQRKQLRRNSRGFVCEVHSGGEINKVEGQNIHAYFYFSSFI